MLALGVAAAPRRGHEVTFETWARWREHVEAAGMRFVAAPEYPVFPTRERPLKPYEAVVLATAETRAARARVRARRRRPRHPHARAGDGRRARGGAGGDADPPPLHRRRSRTSPRTRSARGCPAPRSAGRSGGGWQPLVEAGLAAGPRRAQRDARSASACRRPSGCTAGSARELCIVGTFPSSSTRGPGRRRCTSSAR